MQDLQDTAIIYFGKYEILNKKEVPPFSSLPSQPSSSHDFPRLVSSPLHAYTCRFTADKIILDNTFSEAFGDL